MLCVVGYHSEAEEECSELEVSDDSVNDDLAIVQTNYTEDPPEVFGTVRNDRNNKNKM